MTKKKLALRFYGARKTMYQACDGVFALARHDRERFQDILARLGPDNEAARAYRDAQAEFFKIKNEISIIYGPGETYQYEYYLMRDIKNLPSFSDYLAIN